MQVTDVERAEVLAQYRKRRRSGYASPFGAMDELATSYADCVMGQLAAGRPPELILVQWWAAANAYRASMQGRSRYWYKHRAVKF